MSVHHDDIDFAARTMVDIEPPPDLEAKIKHRLDAQTPTRPTTLRWPVMAGLATVTAMFIILVTARSPEVPESRGPVVRSEVPGARGPAVPQLLPPSGPEVGPRDLGTSGPRNPAANLGTSGPRDRGTSIRPSEAELAWMSRRISPLEMIDPLAMERLSVDSIQPDALSITPLTITPLGGSPAAGEPDTGRQQ
jgi:hypothetical protein